MYTSKAVQRLRTGFGAWSLTAVVLSVVVRLPHLWTPLSVDEGGALAVARVWAHGGTPYTDAWVDRPQGVLALFRWWDALPGTEGGSIRWLSIVLGATAIVGAGWIARLLHSDRAGSIAVIVAALASSAPMIEGYTANGELLAAGFAVPGLAVAVAVLVGRLRWPWMFVSGVLTGLALSMKQSGFDGFVGLGLWLAIALIAGWRSRLRVLVEGLLALAGCALVIGLLCWHGAATFGWEEYRFALFDARVQTRSATNGASWGRLAGAAVAASPILLPAVFAAVLAHRGQPSASQRSIGRIRHLQGCWALAAVGAFVLGGNFHRHYWMTLMFPMAVALGVALGASSVEMRRWGPRLAALPLAVTMVFLVVPSLEYDSRLDANDEIVAWVTQQRQVDSDLTLYAFCANASLYQAVGQDPGFPYLWVDHVTRIDGVEQELVDYLAGARAPTYVVMYQPVAKCSSTPAMAAVLGLNYVEIDQIGGHAVLARRDVGDR